MADPTQPLKPLHDYHPDNTIFLLVGPNQDQMLVHTLYLTSRSDFFRAALSKTWTESQSRVIKLPEDDPQTVAQYLDYVYNEHLPTLLTSTTDQAESMFFALARLYVYGERVLDYGIRDAIVEHFVSYSGVVTRDLPAHPHYPGPEVVEIVYEGTTAASPMRRLLVDMYVRHGSKEWFEPELHPAFSQDVARELMAWAEGKSVDFRGKMMNRREYRVGQ